MIIDVYLLDKISNEIIYEGRASFSIDDDMTKIEFGNYIWIMHPNYIKIHSSSDVDVHMILNTKYMTTAHIDTKFGRIDLQCRASIYTMDKNYIEVKYDLIQGDDKQTFHFVLYLKGENHAIN